MGRPPKKPEDRKKYQLHIPLTDAQHTLIKRAVELDDEDKAEWARAVLLEAAKRRIAKSERKKGNQA